MKVSWLFLILLTQILRPGEGFSFPTGTFDVKIPFAKPESPETYLCTPIKLNPKKEIYIVGFEPEAEAKTAHHILLYGCSSPSYKKPIYNCGVMTQKDNSYSSARYPCGSGSQVVYAWAKNAPNLTLPEGVGFKVGGHSEIQWLVLQVHYASVRYIPKHGDVSGVKIVYTHVPQPKSAGVIYTSTGGRIPARTETHMDAACRLTDNVVIHPFAFRVHTHDLGRVVSGYKVQNGGERWTLLGKGDPQKPQMFYDAANNTTMTKGDVFASRCTMYNHRNQAVWVGNTKKNEMCNFYLMYWVKGVKTMSKKYCMTLGPPLYSWEGWIMGANLRNIPPDSTVL